MSLKTVLTNTTWTVTIPSPMSCTNLTAVIGTVVQNVTLTETNKAKRWEKEQWLMFTKTKRQKSNSYF